MPIAQETNSNKHSSKIQVLGDIIKNSSIFYLRLIRIRGLLEIVHETFDTLIKILFVCLFCISDIRDTKFVITDFMNHSHVLGILQGILT